MAEFTANVGSDTGFAPPNALFDVGKVIQTGQGIQHNQLAMQGQQLDLANANMAQVGQAAAGLLSAYPDEASRAAAYPRVVGMLQSQGFAKNAPPTYPGEGVLRMLAAQGVSSEKQFEYGAGRTAAQGALGALGIGSTGTGTGTTGTTPAGSVATAPSGTIEPAAFNNATAVRDGLIKRGMDPDTATGAAANALHESVANPRTGRGDNSNAAGLFMWTGPRLQAYIDKTGHPPDGAPLDEQLDFLMSEWNGSESAAAAKIAAAQGPAAKAAAFSQYFLRPKDTQAEMQRRSATALQLQQQIGGGPTAASAAPTGGVAARTGGVDVASNAPVAPLGSTASPDAQWDLPWAPAPDQPPAPATTASAPPAATPAAPQVPLSPIMQLQPGTNLTPEQEAAYRRDLSTPGLTVAAVRQIQTHYQDMGANNLTLNRQAEQNNFVRQREAQNDALAQQQRAEAAQQKAIENRRADEKAAREAANDAQLQKSKSDEADAERVLFAIGPKVRAGEPLTEAEADQYDVARRRYARGPVQQVPDGKGGTITAFVGQDVPDRFPPLPGQKEYAGLKPIPGTEKQPDFAPANATTAMLDIAEGQRKIVRTLAELGKHPGGVGLVAGGLPPIMSNWTNPQGVQLRADVGDVKSHIYHTLSGSAVTAIEEPRLQRFAPQETDTPDALKTKLQRMLDLNRETQLDHYRAFGPEAGGRRNPAVEDAILATIPQAALDHLKENPSTTKDFDQMYGRGAAKLALSNG